MTGVTRELAKQRRGRNGLRIGGWHGYFRGEPRAGEAWLSQDRHETIRYHDKTVPNRFVLITETRHFVLVTKIRQGSVGEGHEGLRKTVSAQAMGCGGRDEGGKVEGGGEACSRLRFSARAILASCSICGVRE